MSNINQRKWLFAFAVFSAFFITILAPNISVSAKILTMGDPLFKTKYNTQTCIKDITTTSVVSCALTKFDTKDGVLKEVRVKLTGNVIVDTMAENKESLPMTIAVTTGVKLDVKDPLTGDIIATVNPKVVESKNLGAYDGVVDYGGTSGFSTMGVKSTDTATESFTPTLKANLFNLFVEGSSGDYSKIVNTTSTNGITGPANYAYQGNTAKNLVLDFDYVYEAFDVKIVKTSTPDVFVTGQNAEYTLNVASKENAIIPGGMTVVDTIPTEVTYQNSTAPAGWTCNYDAATRKLTCSTAADIPALATYVIKANVVVANPTKASTVTNNAEVKLNSFVDFDPSDNTTTKKNPINNPPETYDCVIPMKLVNTLITFNTEPLTSVCLRGTDPDPLDYVAKYKINTLPNAAYGTLVFANPVASDPVITVNVLVTPEQLARIQFKPTNNYLGSATYTYSSIDSFGLIDQSPATVTLSYESPDVFIEKKALGTKPYKVNTEQEFTIKYGIAKGTHNGLVEVTDTLPAEMEYISMKNDSGLTCTVTGQELKCTGTQELVVGTQKLITIKYRWKKDFVGEVKNTAKIKTITGELILENNSSEDNFPVVKDEPPVVPPMNEPKIPLVRTGGWIGSMTWLIYTFFVVGATVMTFIKNPKKV
jgi:hypothetical protein